MKFLFISNTSRIQRPYMDPAVRYRCYNPAYDLEKIGHSADVVAFANFKIDMLDNYDVLVFHKPPMNYIVEATVELVRKRGKIAIADYDDLIFDKKNALESSLYLTGRASKKSVIDIFKRNHKALCFFSHVTVSTVALAEQVRLSHPGVTVGVIHNGLNRPWVEASRLRFRKRPVPGQISYFCGTKSHDHDFQLVEDVLAEFLAEKPNASLHIVGPLEFNRSKFSEKQLRTTKAVPYEALSPLIMQSWISIAPLEDNVFNRCKSGIKFFEAGAYGVPTIASPIPDMQRFSQSDIVLAETSAQWRDGLMGFMDEENRCKSSENVKRYSLEECHSSIQTDAFLQFLEQQARS